MGRGTAMSWVECLLGGRAAVVVVVDDAGRGG